jgi:hypothetical protein
MLTKTRQEMVAGSGQAVTSPSPFLRYLLTGRMR